MGITFNDVIRYAKKAFKVSVPSLTLLRRSLHALAPHRSLAGPVPPPLVRVAPPSQALVEPALPLLPAIPLNSTLEQIPGLILITFHQFWKKYQSQQNQGNSQSQGQYNNGQQQGQYPQQGQQQTGAWNNQQSYHPQQGGQGQYQQPQQTHQQYQAPSHGYGAHQGPATNQDMVNAQNGEYVSLRNQAIREGDLMGKAFSASKQAYAQGDGARASELSHEGKQHQQQKDAFNRQAAEWIFSENNKTQPQGSIDLHGLYVQESVDFTERAIQQARSQGLNQLRVIVGKGNHSPQHVAKIKPAIETLMRNENLSAYLDPHNAGVLIVILSGGGGKGSREVMDDLDRSPDTCVVM